MKKTKSNAYAVFVCFVITTLLSACVGQPVAVDCASARDFCVGLVADVGKINDHALNQMAWEAIEKAQLKLGVHAQYIETVDSRDYEKNIATFTNAGYDLIVTVGYNQKKTTLAAANRYAETYFIGVDQPLPADKSLPPNLTGLSFAEDQLGFLAGVLAAQMTRLKKVGAVCGPDFFEPAWRYCEGFKAGVGYINSPPTPILEDTPTPKSPKGTALPVSTPDATLEEEATPGDEVPPEEETPETETPEEETPETETPEAFTQKEFTRKQFALQRKQELTPTETPTPDISGTEVPATETPTVEAIVIYHNDIGFKESFNDPKWDAGSANVLIDGGADVIFGADSYGENGAVSAAARRYKYAIGVNVDQYFTVTDAERMLVSSVIKQVESNLFNLIRLTKNGDFPGGDFIGTVGYAPFHEFVDRVPASTRRRLAEISGGLADGSIQTNVFWRKP